MKKLIILLLVLLLLLGGAGGGAYYYFFIKPEQDAATRQVEEEALPPPPEFVELDSLSVPVIRNGRVVKFVLLKIAVELADGDYRDIVEENMPRVTDAFLRELHGYFATVPVDDPINVRAITVRLMRASRRVFGRGVITDILVQGVYERKSQTN